MKIKTDYNGCKYITAGKVYEAELIDNSFVPLFKIIDDEGDEIWTRKVDSIHLDGHGWEIVEDES